MFPVNVINFELGGDWLSNILWQLKDDKAISRKNYCLSQINYFYVDTAHDLPDYVFGIGLIFKEICKIYSVVACGLLTRD